jgi:hypothetical protein
MFDNASQVQKLAEKALNDESFRSLAKKDPNAALKSVGAKVPDGVKVKVVENSPSTIHVVLPPKADGDALKKLDPNAVKVFQKAWKDAAFKAKLLKDPSAAIKEATGANLPKSLKIVVHEDSAKELNFVLPYLAPKSGELSDADLEMVAGGKGGSGNPIKTKGCQDALATQGAVVTMSAGVAGATGGVLAGGFALVAVGTMFSSFITMAVSASK